METGEVETTSDAATINGEMCRVRHEGTTEKLTETKSQEETEIINEVTETQKIKETKGQEVTGVMNEVTELTETQRETQDYETKDEHTHVELVRDNEVEHGECFVTRCEHQDSLLQGQREMVSSLEADRDEVSPVGPCEVERGSDVNGYTRSLGGMETPGFLVLIRIPDVIVPECVVESMSGARVLKCVPEGEYGVSKMVCVSACEELVHGPIQTGDTSGELKSRKELIWLSRRVRAMARTRFMAHFVHGLHARVCAIAIRREKVPCCIQAGHVDG